MDHVQVARRLGSKAVRAFHAVEIAPASEEASRLMGRYRVPVVVETILERAVNGAMTRSNEKVLESGDVSMVEANAAVKSAVPV